MLSAVPDAFFPYRFDRRFAAIWLPFGARPSRDGVRLTDGRFRASFGLLLLETSLDNVAGGHVTADYRWYTAIGARLSFADDGLTFGTNKDRGVCVHFQQRVGPVLGVRPHSALTVTVEDCEGLIGLIGADAPRR
jgi:hypothetical protein